MIKIKDYEEILKLNHLKEVLDCATGVFETALKSDSPTNDFIKDFTDMGLPQQVMQAYINEGLSVLMPAMNGKKKLDIGTASPDYLAYTGLLNHEFVVGYDTTKGMVTAIFTKSEMLLNKLFKAGAFDNTEKYEKNMKALFGEGKQEYGNKVVTSFEKGSLAMARLDIAGVVGDEVSLDLIVPSKFRDDMGTTFKLYPYIIFPYLSYQLIEFINKRKEGSFQENGKKVVDVRAVTILQAEADGNVKTRRVAFHPQEVVKAYSRGDYSLYNRPTMEVVNEAQEMLKNQIRKTNIKWDCLKMYLKGFNLEASLYGVPYSGIRLERLLKITPCSLKEIDTTQYMTDFDSVRRLFRARVNSWNLPDFIEFNKILDTDTCENIPDRKVMIDAWSNELDDADLLKIMKMKRNLFEITFDGETKTIEQGLNDMERNKPKASKNLNLVDLASDYTERKKQVYDLLSRGVCNIESVSTRTGAPRKYIATNNESVLNAAYRGPNKLLSYESPKRAIERIRNMIKEGKVENLDRFVKYLMIAEIDGLVDYSQLRDTSTATDWLSALDFTYSDLDEKSKAKSSSENVYLVNFRRINADSKSDFYGSVDVRNIESIEFGEQKSK